MKPFSTNSIISGVVICSLAARRGLKKKSLSRSGALAAWVVGVLLVGSGLRGYVLLMFYQIASLATKFKRKLKETYDSTGAESSTREYSQVLACSLLAVIISMFHVIIVGEERAINYQENWLAASLTCAVLSHHSTCLADTLASELGILNKTPPVLISNPWKVVPPGTNGGVTWWGIAMSCIGGAIMGVGTGMMDWISGITPVQPLRLIFLGTLTGLIGSLIDSILGATIQITYQDPETKVIHHNYESSFKQISGRNVLSNAQVNLLSVSITMVLGGVVFGPLIFV